MSTKEAILEKIRQMPDDVTTDDVMEVLFVRRKIEAAIEELDNGGGISHEEAKRRMAKWLS
jgi:hypothetical protein